MKIIYGNLINLSKQGKFDVILHGANCFCAMGAGIAVQIKQNFPLAYDADCQTMVGDKYKLGTISYAYIPDYDITVVNCYTQYMWGANVDYDAIRYCMYNVKKIFSGLRIGLPLIGCGLAGGDWKVVEKIIEEELDNEDVTVVIYN